MPTPEILEIPVEMIVLEFDTDAWVLEIPPSEQPSILITYLPPTPQSQLGNVDWSGVLNKPRPFADSYIVTTAGQQILNLTHLPLNGIKVYINGLKQLTQSMSEIILAGQTVTIPATHLLELDDKLEIAYEY